MQNIFYYEKQCMMLLTLDISHDDNIQFYVSKRYLACVSPALTLSLRMWKLLLLHQSEKLK